MAKTHPVNIHIRVRNMEDVKDFITEQLPAAFRGVFTKALADALVEDLKTLFVEQTLDARIEAALPTLAKIQQQGRNMKEANIFEQWVNHMAEGTWALPDTPEQQAKLEELMGSELIAGPDGTNATEQLYDLVGDDQLFDLIGAAAEADPNVNIWDVPEVIDRLQELGVEVPVNQAADEQTPQAVSESHMSEVDMVIQDVINGCGSTEVSPIFAGTCKSFNSLINATFSSNHIFR